jgi:hypothetical protein
MAETRYFQTILVFLYRISVHSLKWFVGSWINSFIALCKPGFITDQCGRKSEFQDNLLWKSSITTQRKPNGLGADTMSQTDGQARPPHKALFFFVFFFSFLKDTYKGYEEIFITR